jgi:alpha-ketoglutarate-dependent 2,4-dichlorophenoxyacetate dioxygenase
MSNTASRIAVKPLHPLFVAEVTGVDLTASMAQEDLEILWHAFNEHQVLVFPNQPLDDASQMRFSRNFGALETMEAHAANNYKPGHVAVMTNLDDSGKLLPLTHPAMIHRERNEMWHSDSSFKPIGALCSLLHARIVPPVGGNTDFATARAGYESLPAARKAALQDLKVVHRVIAPNESHDTKAYSDEQKKRLTVLHPLVRTNPVHGRKNLYVGSHAQEVVGMSPAEGRALLDELTAVCTQPQFIYSHVWRLHDLVMWDNRCTLHRATPFDKTKYRRTMHRTTVAGMMPESLLARRPEQATA